LSDGRRRAGCLTNTVKDFLSKLKKETGAVESGRGVGTSRRKRGNGGRRRREVPRVVWAVQGLSNNLRTGGGVVKIDLADVGPVSNGEGIESEGRGGGTELGDDGERRGHW